MFSIQEELDRHTYRMIGFSIVFVASGSVLVSLYGPVGVIWANCINMALRISIRWDLCDCWIYNCLCVAGVHRI